MKKVKTEYFETAGGPRWYCNRFSVRKGMEDNSSAFLWRCAAYDRKGRTRSPGFIITDRKKAC